MKFIHAADLHIDSPLRGLEVYDGAPLDRLRGATRAAMQNLVRLAIDQSVDFVILAGDLFDGKWQDMRTGLWTAAQFRELAQAGIPVFLLQGNHDAASKVRQAVTWPENVHVFSVARPETVVLEELNVALHGQGFAREQETTDLAAAYPDALQGMFNIGVLHTSLTGSPEHDTYAPTTMATLLARHYDYWALGHIHARSDPALSQDPYVAYCGNLQGRHIRETGAKGCLLVTVDDGELAGVEFVATDTLRWQRVTVTLQRSDGRQEMLETVQQALGSAVESADGRLLATRLALQGACELNREVAQPGTRAELVAELRNLANDMGNQIWIEKIVFDTTSPVDAEMLLGGHDLLAELLRSIRTAAGDPDQLAELADELKPLQEKAALELSEAGLDLSDPQQIAHWLRQAEAMLVTRLTEFES